MYELKKIGKVFTSKFVGNGPSSYKKRIYRAAVSQRLRNTALLYIRKNISHSTYMLSMKMGAERISEMMVSTYKAMHHVPADDNLLINFCKNLRVAQ